MPGQASPTVTAVDIAGQIFTTSATTTPATSPVVEVASTRSTFNVYLLPRFSFIAPPLECAASTALCTGDEDHEFDINELLQQTVPRSKLNPAFLALIPAVLGPVPLSELVDTIFGYNTAVTPPRFTAFTTSVVLADDLFAMRAGRGYAVKTRSIGGVEPFQRILDPANSQFPSTEIPVPIKLAFDGAVIADPDPNSLLPTTRVERRWNLVSAHTEIDTTVGDLLIAIAVTIPVRTWVQLIAFENVLDISLDDAGKLKLILS